MNNKYELTDETIIEDEVTLYRIKALRCFGNVKQGDLGGFVESEHNLSHDGNCWVYDDAKVFNNAKVFDNAKIFDNAEIFNNAEICDNVSIGGDTKIYDNAKIHDNVKINGIITIYDDAIVSNNVNINGNNISVFDKAMICDDVDIIGNKCCSIGGKIHIAHNATIHADVHLHLQGDIVIGKDAIIKNPNDVFYISGIGSRLGNTTIYKTEKGASVYCGCFNDTLENFQKRVKDTHLTNIYSKEYKCLITLAKIHFNISN